MVSQTGVYDLVGQPTRVGMAVVPRPVGTNSIPDVLVLWTGGRSGGMSANGVLNRLPIVGELLIYTWDSKRPNQLLEVAFPGQTASFDLAASDLATTVSNLLNSATAEKISLCDQLRQSTLSTSGGSGTIRGTVSPRCSQARSESNVKSAFSSYREPESKPGQW